jgi:hypothetical protein
LEEELTGIQNRLGSVDDRYNVVGPVECAHFVL